MPTWAYIAVSVLAAVFVVFIWSLCVTAKHVDQDEFDSW